jgi:hypothetical protein
LTGNCIGRRWSYVKATPDKLVALAHTGLKGWAKVGNLQFPPGKAACSPASDHALLRLGMPARVLLLAEDRLERIADMLDAAYPRYACTRCHVSKLMGARSQKNQWVTRHRLKLTEQNSHSNWVKDAACLTVSGYTATAEWKEPRSSTSQSHGYVKSLGHVTAAYFFRKPPYFGIQTHRHEMVRINRDAYAQPILF